MHLSVLLAFHNTGILQIDQVLLLHGAQLVQHFIRCVQPVETQHDQIAHIDFPFRKCLALTQNEPNIEPRRITAASATIAPTIATMTISK